MAYWWSKWIMQLISDLEALLLQWLERGSWRNLGHARLDHSAGQLDLTRRAVTSVGRQENGRCNLWGTMAVDRTPQAPRQAKPYIGILTCCTSTWLWLPSVGRRFSKASPPESPSFCRCTREPSSPKQWFEPSRQGPPRMHDSQSTTWGGKQQRTSWFIFLASTVFQKQGCNESLLLVVRRIVGWRGQSNEVERHEQLRWNNNHVIDKKRTNRHRTGSKRERHHVRNVFNTSSLVSCVTCSRAILLYYIWYSLLYFME